MNDIEAKHSMEKLRERLNTVVEFIWDGKIPAGRKLWTIPADRDEDFDIVLSNALRELELRRRAMGVEVPEGGGRGGSGMAPPDGTAEPTLLSDGDKGSGAGGR